MVDCGARMSVMHVWLLVDFATNGVEVSDYRLSCTTRGGRSASPRVPERSKARRSGPSPSHRSDWGDDDTIPRTGGIPPRSSEGDPCMTDDQTAIGQASRAS